MAAAQQRRPAASPGQVVDGMFVRRKKGEDIGKTKCGKGLKLMLCVRRDGLPTAALLAPANRAENQLVEPLLEAALADPDLLQVLLGDRDFDDEGLRDRLEAQGIFLLAPHRTGRKRRPRHDGRNLRRYRRR